jgi:hypothetical protein
MVLGQGLYRVRLDLPGGLWTETPLLIRSGDNEALDVPLPDATTDALRQILAAGGKSAPVDGFAEPSKLLGKLVAPTAATVAAIAVVQSVQNYQGSLSSLQLGQRWATGADIGIEMLIVDERSSANLAEATKQHVRLWWMRVTNSAPVAGALVQRNPAVPIASTSLVVGIGGLWLQLRDVDRGRRAGLKLATHVFPEHVTLVIRNPSSSGPVPLLQFAVRRDPPNRNALQLGVVQGEAVQRARAAGRDPMADPAVLALLEGKWFEPISALVAGAALLERGDEAKGMFAELLERLGEHHIQGPDVAVLRAARATHDSQHNQAAQFIRDALEMQQVPIVRSLLERLDSEVNRIGDTGEAAKWVEQKLSETIDHPLWTLRREDDKRRSGKPDAV